MRRLRRPLRAAGFVVCALLMLGMTLQSRRPDCRDIKGEFEGRVRSLLAMHLAEASLQMELKEACTSHPLVGELEKRWHALSYKFGLEEQRPLSWNELRMKSTRDLLQFQDWGDRSWVIRSEHRLAKESRSKLESLLRRYSGKVDTRIEWQRIRAQPRSSTEVSRLETLVEDMRHGISGISERFVAKTKHWNLRDRLTLVLVIAATFSLSLLIGRPYRRMRRKMQKAKPTSQPVALSGFGTGVVFAQAFLEDWRERVDILYLTLKQMSPNAAHHLLKSCHERDPEGLFWVVVNGSPRLRALLLEQLPAEEWIGFEARCQGIQHRSLGEETRGLVRFLIELGQELKRQSGWEQSPLVLHLLTPGDWARLSADLTRSRRRVLAQKLGPVRATWLKARGDLRPDWTTSPRQGEDEAMLLQKVRTLCELHASQLREQLALDTEIFSAMNNFFANLTLDASTNTDLALLCQASWRLKQRTLASRATACDQDFLQVLATLDQESVALILLEFDEGLRERLLAIPGCISSGVKAHLEVFQSDRLQLKRWKARARGLTRFVERQLLIHDILLKSPD